MAETKDQTFASGEKINHTYRDYSHVTADTPTEDIEYEDTAHGATLPGGTRGTDSNFPAKLHHILSQPDLAHIITWLPHGRSWRLVDRQAFLNQVMPNYFSHSNYASFARQVNGWGFKRLSRKGTDYGSYYHELFLRGMPHVAKRMRRPLKIGKKVTADPENEPNLEEISRRRPLPKLSLSKWPFTGVSVPKNNKVSMANKINNDSRLENLLKHSSMLKSLCGASNPFSQDQYSGSSLRHSDLISGGGMLEANSGSLSQENLLQSFLQPQDNSFQAFMNKYNGTSRSQDNSNGMFVSNMLQSNNLQGNVLNPLGSHNLASFSNQDHSLQLALLQQRLRQSESNALMEHRFANKVPESMGEANIAQSYNSLNISGLGINKGTRLNEGSTGLPLMSFPNDHIIPSNNCITRYEDERSVSSDIF